MFKIAHGSRNLERWCSAIFEFELQMAASCYDAVPNLLFVLTLEKSHVAILETLNQIYFSIILHFSYQQQWYVKRYVQGY